MKRRGVVALLLGAGVVRAQQPPAAPRPEPSADPASDAPERRYANAHVAPAAASYAEALQRWRGVADVNAFIAERFSYDSGRALQLSESQRAERPAPPILAPEVFFERPRGVCVDLARFGVETLQRLAPQTQPRYLMIEFDPVQIAGQTLRRHWVVQWREGNSYWFFADSKRPGHIAGPYVSTQAYIDDYAAFRGRRIVAFSERASFQRTLKARAQRQERSEPPAPN